VQRIGLSVKNVELRSDRPTHHPKRRGVSVFKHTEEIWFHPATFTVGVVRGSFIEFMWNGQMEESYFEVIRPQWVRIGVL